MLCVFFFTLRQSIKIHEASFRIQGTIYESKGIIIISTQHNITQHSKINSKLNSDNF